MVKRHRFRSHLECDTKLVALSSFEKCLKAEFEQQGLVIFAKKYFVNPKVFNSTEYFICRELSFCV